MINLSVELDYLKIVLINKGFDESTADSILQNAKAEIESAMQEEGMAAMQSAIEEGVNQGSSDFINQLKLSKINNMLTLEVDNLEFNEPQKPMLPFLLKNAKPIKDGSGVYKVIPVGGQSKQAKPLISSNIYDAWKRENAQRVEAAIQQRNRIAPRGSKVEFRTATSKEDAQSKWVQPEKTKDFSEPLKNINTELSNNINEKIKKIIQEYMEAY
jgi:hypothetical protein